MNDCPIVHPFVSEFHAIIELIDGALCIRDLNSRNGTQQVGGTAIEAGRPFPLSTTNNAFVLGRFVDVQAEPFEQSREIGGRLSIVQGSVIGNRAMLESVPAAGGDPRAYAPGPLAVDASYGVAQLPPLSADGRSMLARPPILQSAARPAVPAMSESLPPLAPLRPGFPGDQPNAYAPVLQGPPMRAPSGQPPPRGGDPSRATEQLSMGIETMALVGLRELAASLVPGVPLQTTGDLARLMTKLHDTLEVFCRSFVPLRDGYTQFISSTDLRRAASQRLVHRSNSARSIETARDPAAVAAALLDWRTRDFDAPEVLEGILADLVMHHVALMEGVMRGVHALLDELSPENVERALQSQPSGGAFALLGRYRALWQTFKDRHQELTNEQRTFDLVFGPEFAASYREYARRQSKPGT